MSVFLIDRAKPVLKGPTVNSLYDLPFTSVSSFVLLMSSLTMVLALAAIQRGEHRRARTWILATAILGSSFVAGQVYEFTSFVKEGMGFTTNLQSSAFFALTGFHGVHVTIGIIMLLSLYTLSLRGKLPSEKAETVEIVGLYWHFVDVVWIVIFTVVYLIKP
jgi:cytochrome c oxidase subunit 3/cytochrome o ubiquinol oxidase subunit 3